jgi:hypothetical protein
MTAFKLLSTQSCAFNSIEGEVIRTKLIQVILKRLFTEIWFFSATFVEWHSMCAFVFEPIFNIASTVQFVPHFYSSYSPSILIFYSCVLLELRVHHVSHHLMRILSLFCKTRKLLWLEDSTRISLGYNMSQISLKFDLHLHKPHAKTYFSKRNDKILTRVIIWFFKNFEVNNIIITVEKFIGFQNKTLDKF